MFTDDTWRQLATALRLSRREAEILRGVFDDQKESSIAETLRISPHTVHSHIERLYRKLRVGSRVSLVVRVFDEYLTLTATPAPQHSPSPGRPTLGRLTLGQPTVG